MLKYEHKDCGGEVTLELNEGKVKYICKECNKTNISVDEVLTRII